MDSEGGQATKVRRPGKYECDICSGGACKYNFGVLSCNACRQFFKRIVHKNLYAKVRIVNWLPTSNSSIGLASNLSQWWRLPRDRIHPQSLHSVPIQEVRRARNANWPSHKGRPFVRQTSQQTDRSGCPWGAAGNVPCPNGPAAGHWWRILSHVTFFELWWWPIFQLLSGLENNDRVRAWHKPSNCLIKVDI